MLAAIGIILILKQMPHFVGYDKGLYRRPNFLQQNSENTFTGILSALNSITPTAILIGAMCLAFQFCGEFCGKKTRMDKINTCPIISGIDWNRD